MLFCSGTLTPNESDRGRSDDKPATSKLIRDPAKEESTDAAGDRPDDREETSIVTRSFPGTGSEYVLVLEGGCCALTNICVDDRQDRCWGSKTPIADSDGGPQ